MSDAIVICECFARDGLQHEPVHLDTTGKIAAIDAFTAAGFSRIEATSYSHPKHVPAFGDASAVLAGITRRPGVRYKATCPNLRAIERALADQDAGHGAEELSLLVSATEAHTARNLRTTRDQQWQNVTDMVSAAAGRFRLVGVISMALGCPFEGAVSADSVAADVERFARLGVDLVTIGDTAGLGTPGSVRALFRLLLRSIPDVVPVAHFHNTRGTGLANCMAALEVGATHFDSAMGGVGGHPAQIQYGEGMTGNVATEDLVNLFEGEGVSTGIDPAALLKASQLCEHLLGRELNSLVARSGFGLAMKEEIDG